MVEAVPETVRAVEEAYGAVILPLPKVTAWLLVVLMERVEALSISKVLAAVKEEAAVKLRPALVR